MSQRDYAILVRGKTRLEQLVERFNTLGQARFYIESAGGEFAEYEAENDRFQESFSLVQRQLSALMKNKIVERSFLPAFLFDPRQLIVVVGPDGLVANTAKYVGRLPIVAINPDPARNDGVLLPFTPHTFGPAVERVLAGKFAVREASLAEVRLQDGQRLLAFNDLFIGAASHVSARYRIRYQQTTETHSSSGIIVSTASGATGWLSSVFNMNAGLVEFLDPNENAPPRPALAPDELLFVVREAFRSQRTQCGLTAGVLNAQVPLVVESMMPANGVIFSDGVESDFLHFNAGAIATIGVAPEKANLVVA
ncbi:NAD(+)/NADH kinase [Hymenobacter lapidiphilus]|uniref:NAD(+)/NADH kinase n=1 Tax=Hymenobacter lapidiphilus TaxID=2608003 RepID=A0A7Y7PR04_9BACT|nr:NAD(+)/NADH kinase [Hymenobacter lapidiphilus]NVO32441.1 NAD(+)/NADH kinase [Hymenobacter lapidiphilus]